MGFSLFGKNKQSKSDTDADELEGKAAPRRRRKSAEEPVDPVLPEKKRARRRLVGVAAMVLAAIIGLPMLMESEPQPLSDDVQIIIPSAEKPVADARPANPEPSEPANSPSAPDTNTVAQAAAPATKPAPAIPDSTAASAPFDSLAVAKPLPDAGKTAGVKPEAPKTAQPQVSTESERIAQVKALLEGQGNTTNNASSNAAKAETSAKQGKFALQVAALASPEKAKELQARLSKSGVTSYTEKVKLASGEQIRVRVGPFTSREEADKMRSKLSGMGYNGMVVPI